MDIFTIAIWIGTIIFLIFSMVKNKEKTKIALKMAFGMGKNMTLSILSIILLIGLILAFPLVGTLVDAGVEIVPAVAFLTTLTMVGIVTFPLEKKEFGMKFTIVRNGLSFIFAIIIALVMGVII